MDFFYSQNITFKNPVITMGTFDGVHLGHQKLIKAMVKKAKEDEGEAILITYHHHPLEIIYKNPFPYLLSEKKSREKILRSLGVDHILYLNFTKEMAAMDPLDFLKEVLINKLNPKAFVIGYDTHFGKNRSGDINFLKAYKDLFEYQLQVVEPFRLNGKIVSSSWCREYVRAGDVEELPKILGRAYCIHGAIVTGNKIGRTIGFPTINLKWDDPNKLIPKTGIYLSKVFLHNKEHWGVTNIGYRPTVIDKSDLTVETHILDFNQDVYGERVKITFEKRLRSEYKLKDIKELKEYIANDIIDARTLIKNWEK